MMFLKKLNNQIIIRMSSEELTIRNRKVLKLLSKGKSACDDELVFEYSKEILSKVIEFLDSKNCEFTYDDSLNEIFNKTVYEQKRFDEFSKNALTIKNNLDLDSDGYMGFINQLSNKMSRRLYDFQLRAAYHMAFSVNSCNFSVPGAGKTSVVYGAYTYLKEKKVVDKLLIIGPLSSFGPWKNEYRECFGESADIMNLSVLNNPSKQNYLINHSDLIHEINFVNYEGFTKVIDNMNVFMENNNVMLVLDEAHKIKNPNSLRSKNVMAFSKNASSRVVLTGTPLPNGYKDLYNLFEFIWPEKNVIGYKYNILNKIDKMNNRKQIISNLLENIDPYYVRIRKEYLNLPKPKFHTPILVEMGKIQSQIYGFIVDDFLTSDTDMGDADLQYQLKRAKLIRLMQTITNPNSISNNSNDTLQLGNENSNMMNLISNYEKLEVPPKFKTLLNLVEKIVSRNEKVIIWTTFTYNVLSLQSFLAKAGIESKLLYGGVDNYEREQIILDFHQQKSFKVIIANPAAVAESISLHKACNNAVYLDKSFNAAHYMQSKDRIHRVGLKAGCIVNYYFLISKDSIDQVIHERILFKEKIMLDVIEGNEVPLFANEFGSEFSQNDVIAVENYLNGMIT